MTVQHRVVATDRCPGLLRPYQSADGALVRLRVPGGRIAASTLGALTGLAASYGDGTVQITSRGSLQLRGVSLYDGDVDPGLESAVVGLGLLPHPTHELIRTIAASPLSGTGGGLIDVMPVVRELDARMCAEPQLARLPGRFLWAVDDGRRDMAGLDADLTFIPTTDSEAVVLVAGGWVTIGYSYDGAIDKMITIASRFVDARERLHPRPWRIAELALPGEELSDDLHPCDRLASPQLTTGIVGDGVATVLMPRLGVITADQGRALEAAYGDQTLVVTPWRQIVVPGDGWPLATLGMESDPQSPWTRITACAGAPGCRNGRFNTHSTAADVAVAMTEGAFADGLPVHVVACERQCGTPSGPHQLIDDPTITEPQ